MNKIRKEGIIMNYLLVSPNFPTSQENFAKKLVEKGVKVLGIGSESYDNLSDDLKNALNEYNNNNSSKAPVDRATSTPVDNRTVTTEKNKAKTQTTENETSIADYAREKVRSVVGGISGTTSTASTVGSAKSKATTSTESYYEKGMKNINSNPRVASKY